MSKRIEFFQNGIRKVQSKKDCHSCYDCIYLQDVYDACIDGCLKMCFVAGKSEEYHKNFPYDNTKCKEWRNKDDKE